MEIIIKYHGLNIEIKYILICDTRCFVFCMHIILNILYSIANDLNDIFVY